MSPVIPKSALTRKDFVSDQEVRWCPGCGDYAILAAVYWWYPRAPRTLARWSFDASALATTTLLSIASMHWSYGYADPSAGAIWKQVLATSVSSAWRRWTWRSATGANSGGRSGSRSRGKTTFWRTWVTKQVSGQTKGG